MKATGIGADGSIRIIELATHHFFMATLFVPQLSSSPQRPHPLILWFLKIVTEGRGDR